MENNEPQEEAMFAPASPGAQYLNSSALSLTVMAIMESEVPLDESLIIPHIKNVLFPLNPRFSRVMVPEENGSKKWKRVEVNFENHIIVPNINLPIGQTLEFHDNYMTEYISKLAMEQLPQHRPLWQIHIVKCPTSNAAGTVIFKLHHSLGDGYSLMGLVLSGLHRVDNPLLPLTFPSRDTNISKPDHRLSEFIKSTPKYLKRFMYTLSDFGWSILKSKLMEDEPSPIRSGDGGVEFRPVVVTTMTFPLDSIKQIKDKLKVTINDVITGIIMMGTRLYMKEAKPECGGTNCNALVLLNTRAVGNYKSVSEMMKPNSKTPWGNHFAFLHIPIPKLTSSTSSDLSNNPLYFISEAHKMIKKKRNSASVYLTGTLLDALRRIKGAEATAGYIHGTLKNSSLTISNVIGPIDQFALATHPINSLYFFVAGAPQSLAILILSYMGYLKVAIAVEKDFIDPNKFKACVNNAFEIILKEVVGSSSIPTGSDYQ